MKRLLMPILVVLILSGCSLRIREENAEIKAMKSNITETTVTFSTTIADETETEETETEATTEVIITTEQIAVKTTKAKEMKLRSLGTFKLTAYCPCSECCGEWQNGITSTGTYAKANHTISVDPDVIPYGATVLINGSEYVAEDCGGGISGNEIDVYFDTHEEACDFGVQYAEVFIYEV